MSKEIPLELTFLWLTEGIDLESRRIEVREDVTEKLASKIIRALIKMTEISHDPIELYLSSGGGEIYSGLAIFDAIRECPCDVNIIGSGQLFSAAFIIYLAGDQRIASENTSFMIHSISYGTEGSVKQHEIEVNEAKIMNNKFLDICAERTKPNRKWWYRHLNGSDKYFKVNEAKELGIITTPVKTPKRGVKKNVRRKTKRK